MKPYKELTRLGRVRRMRQLARVALDAYGLADARFEFVLQAGTEKAHTYPEVKNRPG